MIPKKNKAELKKQKQGIKNVERENNIKRAADLLQKNAVAQIAQVIKTIQNQQLPQFIGKTIHISTSGAKNTAHYSALIKEILNESDPKDRRVKIVGRDKAICKTVSVGEVVKREIQGVRQTNRIYREEGKYNVLQSILDMAQ